MAPPAKRGSTSTVAPFVSVISSVEASASSCSADHETMLSGATIGRGALGSDSSPATFARTGAGGNSAAIRTAEGCEAASILAATLGSRGAMPPTTMGSGGGGLGGRITSGRIRSGGGDAWRSERYAASRCCARARSSLGAGAVGSKSTAESETSP